MKKKVTSRNVASAFVYKSIKLAERGETNETGILIDWCEMLEWGEGGNWFKESVSGLN